MPKNQNNTRNNASLYLAILMCALVMHTHAQAQYDALHMVALDTLEAHTKLAYNVEWTAKRKEYDYKIKGSWTKYVPNVGLTFGLPSVSWSPNTIFETGNQKRLLRAKLASLDADYAHKLNKALADLRIEYQKIQIQIQAHRQAQDLFKIKTEIFDIVEAQNKAHEIIPADYLTKKLAYQEAKTALNKQEKDLQVQILELYKNASYKLPNRQIYYLPQEDCEIFQRQPKPQIQTQDNEK